MGSSFVKNSRSDPFQITIENEKIQMGINQQSVDHIIMIYIQYADITDQYVLIIMIHWLILNGSILMMRIKLIILLSNDHKISIYPIYQYIQ